MKSYNFDLFISFLITESHLHNCTIPYLKGNSPKNNESVHVFMTKGAVSI